MGHEHRHDLWALIAHRGVQRGSHRTIAIAPRRRIELIRSSVVLQQHSHRADVPALGRAVQGAGARVPASSVHTIAAHAQVDNPPEPLVLLQQRFEHHCVSLTGGAEERSLRIRKEVGRQRMQKHLAV